MAGLQATDTNGAGLPTVLPAAPGQAAVVAPPASATPPPAPTPPPRPAITWQCAKEMQFDQFPAEAPVDNLTFVDVIPLEAMTVGRKFLLRCQGEPVFFDRKGVELVLQTSQPTMLKLLELRRIDEKSADLVVTSYMPGEYKIADAILSDSTNKVGLSEIPLNVQSIMAPPQDGKPPEPFPPFGPFQIAWPWYYWVLLASVILFFVAGIARKIWQHIRWKRLQEELEAFSTAMQPYNQFNKELRQIHRRFDYVEDEEQTRSAGEQLQAVEEAFRLYLVRELRLPALTWSDSALLKVMRQKSRQVYDSCGQELRLTLREFKKANSSGGRLSSVDCQELAKLSQKTITKVWQVKKMEERRD